MFTVPLSLSSLPTQIEYQQFETHSAELHFVPVNQKCNVNLKINIFSIFYSICCINVVLLILYKTSNFILKSDWMWFKYYSKSLLFKHYMFDGTNACCTFCTNTKLEAKGVLKHRKHSGYLWTTVSYVSKPTDLLEKKTWSLYTSDSFLCRNPEWRDWSCTYMSLRAKV